ncbi:MAG: hypothetical protein QW286_03160 [Candidatus Aenigmatarchaeota archaeon]
MICTDSFHDLLKKYAKTGLKGLGILEECSESCTYPECNSRLYTEGFCQPGKTRVVKLRLFGRDIYITERK